MMVEPSTLEREQISKCAFPASHFLYTSETYQVQITRFAVSSGALVSWRSFPLQR